MKKIIAIVLMSLSMVVNAAEEKKVVVDVEKSVSLMKKNMCFSCHSVDKKVVGPAFKDVAKHYKGVKEYSYNGKTYSVRDGLLEKVSLGGKGVWGNMNKPANDEKRIKQEDFKQIIEYILSL